MFYVSYNERSPIAPNASPGHITTNDDYMNVTLYTSDQIYACGIGTEMLPEFPGKYKFTYQPGGGYYECFFVQSGCGQSECSGQIIYTDIDNPL